MIRLVSTILSFTVYFTILGCSGQSPEPGPAAGVSLQTSEQTPSLEAHWGSHSLGEAIEDLETDTLSEWPDAASIAARLTRIVKAAFAHQQWREEDVLALTRLVFKTTRLMRLQNTSGTHIEELARILSEQPMFPEASAYVHAYVIASGVSIAYPDEVLPRTLLQSWAVFSQQAASVETSQWLINLKQWQSESSQKFPAVANFIDAAFYASLSLWRGSLLKPDAEILREMLRCANSIQHMICVDEVDYGI